MLSYVVRVIKNRAEQKPAVFGETRSFNTKREAVEFAHSVKTSPWIGKHYENKACVFTVAA